VKRPTAQILTRRATLAGAMRAMGAAGLAGVLPLAGCSSQPTKQPLSDQALIDDVEYRTFRFFWETVNRRNGLVPDLWPADTPCNLCSVGFALVAYGVGVERGWVTRSEAREITLTTLRFFDTLPMGAGGRGFGGYRGMPYHYLDMQTGLRAPQSEISCIDVALLHMGFLYAAQWFDAPDAGEAEIRRLAHKLVNAADWAWFAQPADRGILTMGWTPEKGFNAYRWAGYSEAKCMVLLALASENHPIPPGSWQRWTDSCASHWREFDGRRYLGCAPLFTHQYSEMWIDFRGIRDELMRGVGMDYFENGRIATLANRDYCQRNPMGWRGYSQDLWGLTGSNGPGSLTGHYRGKSVQFQGYAMRGPDTAPGGFDDGTVAPTAAISAMPFTPEISIAALGHMHRQYGHAIYKDYGFVEAFNPSFAETGLSSKTGRVVAGAGWVDHNYFSLDQGPIVGMIANHKNGGVWRVMRKSGHLQRALRLAGFEGGWLADPLVAQEPRLSQRHS